MLQHSMLPILLFLRQKIMNIPIPIGELLSNIPYELRPGAGTAFRRQKALLAKFSKMNDEQRKNFILEKMKFLTTYVFAEVQFYHDLYKKRGFHPDQLVSFEDIQRIPIVEKKDFLEYPIEYYSNMNAPKYLANTGGSSGRTFSFFHSPEEMGSESASVFDMWHKQAGYVHNKLKLGFSSKGNMSQPVMYDLVRHTLCMDMYSSYAKIEEQLIEILKKTKVYYLHGYPSSFYEFACQCEKSGSELRSLIQENLRGVFLSSEIPFPHYREKIEQVFGAKTYAFYGHTERCIEAYELTEPFTYEVQQSYGYAEVLKLAEDSYDLIGTNYQNLATPLIRYNTKDIACNPFFDDSGILKSFQIREGRAGDFVTDKNGKSISLTGLIFGKHHLLFDCCSHIQVYQNTPGKCHILFTPKDDMIGKIQNPAEMFNSTNVQMDFEFTELKEPIHSPAGKILLKITDIQYNKLYQC